MAKTREIEVKLSDADYKVVIGDDLLARSGRIARKVFGKDSKTVCIVSNETVFGLYGGKVSQSLKDAGCEVTVFLMKDGEQYKSIDSVLKALEHFAETKLKRTDVVVSLGGGVVGDLAGFAASIYLRGIKFIQIPTTLLSMVDSSVGGKTGVNAAFGKNTVGTFHQPSGVIVDVNTLATLPTRELTAGFCEIVKHGAIGGRALLAKTSNVLERWSLDRFSTIVDDSDLRSEVSDLIASNVEFKAKIVAGDEREDIKRKDARSRKILNFGHTLAHALEKVTDYKYFKHGEAVGYGILYAAELSKSLALCDKNDVKLLYDVLHRVGALPTLADIDFEVVFEAFRFDKKISGSSLQMVLLKGIGRPVVISTDGISRSTHANAFKRLLKF